MRYHPNKGVFVLSQANFYLERRRGKAPLLDIFFYLYHRHAPPHTRYTPHYRTSTCFGSQYIMIFLWVSIPSNALASDCSNSVRSSGESGRKSEDGRYTETDAAIPYILVVRHLSLVSGCLLCSSSRCFFHPSRILLASYKPFTLFNAYAL